MILLFVILIIIASVVLGFIVLIQNPKGGGLTGTFAGVSSQFMGVKQTNDVMERGTWIFAAIIGVLSLLATFFISGGKSNQPKGRLQDVGTMPVQQQPAQPAAPFSAPVPGPAPAPATPAK
ncbi:MAG TPA: preprotein translocase subunit SecG [Niabella sp.]|jgi:preprotein translocase subunit SecG|nr:preprotein translocase subunit SecG [Chitinophagaceae bacterium]HRN46497.1 preprotein translocase subunit SecG [Niabella sp.]HRO84944.1 preprotein translocase subunit SecG [Niabella sp.]HUN02003.1 preprotein translocase subunit SecG [Niabella sp.]